MFDLFEIKAPQATREALTNLQASGIKFNIVTKVDFRFEVHFASKRLDGKERVHFVAELDGFGNVVEWGPYMKLDGTNRPVSKAVINADGEIFA